MGHCLKAWDLIDELEDAIFNIVESCYAVHPPPGLLEDFDDGLAALHAMKKLVAECGANLRDDVIGQLYMPLNKPRIEYFRGIFSTWTALGGKLGVSKHPASGAIGGPLTRFFFAVATPVMGSKEVPAMSTFPAIVSSYKKLCGERNGRPTIFLSPEKMPAA
jgi:hypothetical protein